MLLAIDVGNTNVVLGIFDQAAIKARWRIQTERRRMSDEWGLMILGLLTQSGFESRDITATAISSVVPSLTVAFREMGQRYFNNPAFVVEPGIHTGLTLCYENSHEVGADRIVNAVAAYHKYEGPSIIIDFGTATTFDVISVAGHYLGGAIAPGVNIAAEALFQVASRLFRVELALPRQAIGRNITNSMQSGIMFSYIGLVEGLVRRLKEELQTYDSQKTPVKVIGTGGLASIIARESNQVMLIDFVDEDLTLEGLRLLYLLNHS